jgi:DNA-binding XRE family transcriptional regulator
MEEHRATNTGRFRGGLQLPLSDQTADGGGMDTEGTSSPSGGDKIGHVQNIAQRASFCQYMTESLPTSWGYWSMTLQLCMTLCIVQCMDSGSQTHTFTLGDRLRKARRQSGVTSQDMAELLGASRTTVSNYENGRSEPTATTVAQWADITGADLVWLIVGDALKSRCFSTEIDQLELFANTAAVAA